MTEAQVIQRAQQLNDVLNHIEFCAVTVMWLVFLCCVFLLCKELIGMFTDWLSKDDKEFCCRNPKE